MMRVLYLGDIVGRGARNVLRRELRSLRKREDVGFVVGNGENASGGRGIDPNGVDELLDAGLDLITTGNHIWKHREIEPVLESEPRLIRPANFPRGNPGRGSSVVAARDGTRMGVMNLIGRVFMGDFDCPFRAADTELERMRGDADVVLVDMHAETTSEKSAMGWYLDGRVSLVVGSHTHVQTADERILPEGTGFLTDAGMCGPIRSVIGQRRQEVIERFLSQRPARFEVAKGPILLQGVFVDIDIASGRATNIRRLQLEGEG
ncbi:MAG: TIGR00282 family metallophosphoesterase [Deltaproteobacteria bacterium]